MNLPKKSKKGKWKEKLRNVKVIERIKEKNKSTGKERDTFGQKVRLFNEHLTQIFSDQLESEKRSMLVYTKLVDTGEFQTFVDDENRERMYIDWGNEFSDSEEDIYATPKDSVVSRQNRLKKTAKKRKDKPKKGTDALLQDQRLGEDQLGENYWEDGYQTIDRPTAFSTQKKSPSNWKKFKGLFKSTGSERPVEELADQSFFSDRNADRTAEEPIYEEIRPDLDKIQKDLSRDRLKDLPKGLQKDNLIPKIRAVQRLERPIPPPLPPFLEPKQSVSSPESSLKSTGFTPALDANIPPPPPMPGIPAPPPLPEIPAPPPLPGTVPAAGIPPPPPMPGKQLTQPYQSPTKLTGPKRLEANRSLPPTPPSTSPDSSLRSERADRSPARSTKRDSSARSSRRGKRPSYSFRNMFRRVSRSSKHETIQIKPAQLTNLKEDNRRRTAGTFKGTERELKDKRIGKIGRMDKK